MQLILQSLAEPNSSSGSRNDSNINRGNLNYTPKHYWASMENQKAFFDQLGMKLGFKDRAAWYNVSFKDGIILSLLFSRIYYFDFFM